MARVFICGDTGFGPMLDEAAQRLRHQGHCVVRGSPNVAGETKTYSTDEQASLFGEIDAAVFTARHACSRDVFTSARRLRGVCYPVIGVETVDMSAAADLGVIVGHGAVPSTVTGMAEATVMLMLMLAYQVEANVARMSRGEWRPGRPIGRQLKGKTVGLIGFGRIAGEVAARLTPFGVRIITVAPYTPDHALPAGVLRVDLHTLMRESDVVSILTGLTSETRHMLGEGELALMKGDAWLVNTGRGEVVDEAALARHLHARRIAGAALDTFTLEPLPADSPLRSLDNVILTPHCVGHTQETLAEILPALIENVGRILDDRLPLYCANPDTEPAWRERLARLGPPAPSSPRQRGAA